MKRLILLAWFFFYLVPPSTEGHFSPLFETRQECERMKILYHVYFNNVVPLDLSELIAAGYDIIEGE